MKNLLILLLLAPLCAFTQSTLPSYPEILKNYFDGYSFSSENRSEGLNFAKKKDGWYVQVVDRQSDVVKAEQIFWSVRSNRFLPLKNQNPPLSTSDAVLKISQYLNGQASTYNYYGYDRCPYFGYDNWATDVIHDFGGGDLNNYSDTLLEGLGRAYSSHSNTFLWYQFGGADKKDDWLQKKLLPLEKPSQRRIDSVVSNINKAINVFQILATRFPAYRTLVGNSGMKVFNEQMNGYMQTAMAGYDAQAKKFILSINPNKTISQMAKNYLATCPPNSILFTFGDNDTYPLWYVQERENYRKDVAVLNVSLLGFQPYINMVRKKKSIRFETGPEIYGDPKFTYFLLNENVQDSTLSLKDLLNMLRTRNLKSDQGENFMAYYPSKNIRMEVDLDKFKKMSKQSGFTSIMNFQLGKYLLNEQFMILDIVATNFYTRPILFAAYPELFGEYVQREGFNFRLLPLDSDSTASSQKASFTISQNYLFKTYKDVNSFETSSGISSDGIWEVNIYGLYVFLVHFHLENGSKEKARQLLSKLFHQYKNDLPFAPNLKHIGILSLESGYEKEGISMIEKYAITIYEAYQTPQPITGFYSKESITEDFIQLRNVLDEANVKSEVINNLLEKLPGE